MATELVIFDCDGVLIDSEVISAQMLIEALAGFGVTIDRAFVAKHFLGRSYPTVLSEVHGRFGVTLPHDFETLYRQRLMAAFERDLRIMPGVRAVLDALAPRACVATSSSPLRVQRSLDLVGLSARFGGDVFTSTMVAQGKPAPDLFLHAAARFGVAHDRCLVIEDSLNGVRAARAAGMPVWRFIGGSHFAGLNLDEPDDARPDLHFADFADFFGFDPALKAA